MRCPLCGEEIANLVLLISRTVQYFLGLDAQGGVQCETCDFKPGDSEEYSCPECCKVLFYSRDKAVAFLRGLMAEIIERRSRNG